MLATGTRGAQLRDKVRAAYSAAAERPREKHPFPIGRKFAENIGYPAEVLATIPSVATDTFTGVSNVSIFADVPSGAIVLDLGCGSGTDTLIAARRVGSTGKVVGVDFSDAMLSRARKAMSEAGVGNVELRASDAERLPLADAEVDVALVNGIFNLNPFRDRVFQELARVIRPGGKAYAAELILSQPLPAEVRNSETNWFA